MKDIWKSNFIQITSYLNRTIENPSIIIVAIAIFLENKYYPQVFLDEFLYKM